MRKSCLCSTSLLALCLATPAMAGEEEASPANGGIEEIIVTAQKRTEPLQKVAVPVSVLTGEALTRSGVTQATELTKLVPALQVAPATAYTQIYLRGIGTFGANAFAEQGVSFNLDGVYLSRPAAPSAVFYDLERIEVIKGPQGTLFGRNSTGGAVNLVTARPSLSGASASLNAEYGNYDTLKISSAVNLPIASSMALRVSGQLAKHDGYYSDGYDDEDTSAMRVQFRLNPSSDFDFNLAFDYGHVGGQGPGGTIVPLLAGKRRLGPSDPAVVDQYLARSPSFPVPQNRAGADGFLDNDYYGAVANANGNLGFATLTAIAAWRNTKLNFLSYTTGYPISVAEDSDQQSLEVRLSNQSPQLKWVLGGYFFVEDVRANEFYNLANNGSRRDADLSTNSIAVFGEATYSLAPSLRLTAGARHTRDRKEQVTEAHSYPFFGFVDPAFPLFRPIIGDIRTDALTDAKFSATTWKVGVEADLGPQSLLYATASTGFKSGVLFAALGSNYSRPEKLTAYTFGSKNRFAGGTIQLNAEAFYWDYKDQQISHLAPVVVATVGQNAIYGPVFRTSNAGAATIYGAEVDLIAKVDPTFTATASIQYLHSNYDRFEYQAYSNPGQGQPGQPPVAGPPPVNGCTSTLTGLTAALPLARIYDVNCSGKPLVNAPRWTMNLGLEKTFPLRGAGNLRIGVDNRIESSRFLSVDFMNVARQDNYWTSNANLTWSNRQDDLSITAYVNNIQNRLIFSNSIQNPGKPGTFYNQLRSPRLFGVRVSKKI